MGRHKLYNTKEERLQAHREACKHWIEKNPEKYKEKYFKDNEKRKDYKKEWYEKNKKHILKKRKEVYETLEGRCKSIRNDCISADRRKGRIGNELPNDYITLEQTMELISRGKCAHYEICGCEDWKKIGLNRLDNSKPHTYENCEPCCFDCNCRLNDEERRKPVFQRKNGELIRVWESISECEKAGYTHAWECCLGKRKQDKGYEWSYAPL